MKQIAAVYEGKTHCTVTDQDGHVVLTAAPREHGGDESNYGPTDFLGVALASCMMTVMSLWAERHGLDLRGSSTAVTKEIRGGKITAMPAHVTLPAVIDVEHRKGLEEAAHRCPVHASLHADIAAPISFSYSL